MWAAAEIPGDWPAEDWNDSALHLPDNAPRCPEQFSQSWNLWGGSIFQWEKLLSWTWLVSYSCNNIVRKWIWYNISTRSKYRHNTYWTSTPVLALLPSFLVPEVYYCFEIFLGTWTSFHCRKMYQRIISCLKRVLLTSMVSLFLREHTLCFLMPNWWVPRSYLIFFSTGNPVCYFPLRKWEKCHRILSVLEKTSASKDVVFTQGLFFRSSVHN